MRQLVPTSVLLLLAALLPFRAGAQAGEGERPFRPNILWITTEDMSPRLGAYGDTLARTPNLDRFAEAGTRYTNAFSVSGVCAPSRSALITGVYPISIGTHQMRTTHEAPGLPGPYLAVPPPEVKAFTEYLRAAGYYTSNNAKTDYQFGTPVTAWDESSNEAHWRNREPGQPFFSVFNSTRTHESKVWPDSTEERTTPREAVVVPPYYPDTDVVREDLARHYDNIARMDTWVGEILAELEADGLADSTIVFFYSDHGDGLPRAKRWVYDSGLHVPLMIRWPEALRPERYAPGSTEERLVSFVDFGPTVLSIADVEVPASMQGKPFLGGQEVGPRDYIYAARDRHDEAYDRMRAVRDDRFKYIRNYMPETAYVQPIAYRDRMPTMQELLRLSEEGRLEGPQALWFRQTRPEEELYDTHADPHEVGNLADDPEYQDVLERMRGALDAWLERVGDMGATPEAEMVEAMWPGGEQPTTEPPVILAEREGEAVRVEITSPTEGASVAYTTDAGEDARWKLYDGPFEVAPGTAVRAKAIRYGYAESKEMVADV